MADAFNNALTKLADAAKALRDEQQKLRVIDKTLSTIVAKDYPDGMPPDVKANLRRLLSEQTKAKRVLNKAKEKYAIASAKFAEAVLHLALGLP